MNKFSFIMKAAAALLLMSAVSPAAAEKLPPLKLVPALDPQKYLGLWYENARYQHSFEKDLAGAAAEYSLKEDGRIAVRNSGFKKDIDGKYTSVEAVAWIPDTSVPGALKVKFFGLFTSDYLVFGLDENYQWAVVGNNDRKFLWFLTREPEVSQEVFDTMYKTAQDQGYDMSKLYKVPQKKR